MEHEYNVEIKNIGSGFMMIVSRNGRVIHKDLVPFDFLFKKERELDENGGKNEGIDDE